MTIFAGALSAMGFPDRMIYFLGAGIIVYIIGMLFIGAWASKKVKGMNDFLVAGRRLPLWMATATLLATWFGAGSSMGVAANVYSSGLGSVIQDPFAASISLILAGIFIVGMLRKAKCLTVTDIVERRFGKWAGIYTSLWMVPVYVGWLGAQVMGLGTILHLLTGMNPTAGCLIGAGVVLVYTLAGGMWAVTLTDVIQVSLIVCGLFLIVPGAVAEAGGWETILDSIPAKDLSFDVESVMGDTTFSSRVEYLGNWLIMGLGCMVGQDLVQRSLASRDEKVAVSSSVISGFLYVGIAMVPITIGFAARLIFKKYNIDTDSMDAQTLENGVLPHVAMIVLGKTGIVFLILFLSALISAIMSSADSSLLAAASLLTNNVIRGIRPGISDRKLLSMTRFMVVALMVIATVLAMNAGSIYQLMVNSWASQLVVVFLPVVAALYLPKASRNSIWACMTVSSAVWLIYCFLGSVGIDLPLVKLLESDRFNNVMICGAVYGFLSGTVAFFAAYWGERLPHYLEFWGGVLRRLAPAGEEGPHEKN